MRQQPPAHYFVGLDLGSLADFTGLAVVERPCVHSIGQTSARGTIHSVRHLQRFPPGTFYVEVVEVVRELFCQPPIAGSILIVDQTGVGKAVTDWFAAELQGRTTGHYHPVGISAGQGLTLNEQGLLLIPKKELAGNMQVLLQTQRLRVARSLPEAPMLVKELENFKVKVTALPDNTLESWREGERDDLVLAVALAAYASEVTLAKC
jgi:hypothetical protein